MKYQIRFIHQPPLKNVYWSSDHEGWQENRALATRYTAEELIAQLAKFRSAGHLGTWFSGTGFSIVREPPVVSDTVVL